MLVKSSIYEYTSTDRLITPHKYMYTAYAGEEFIKAYFDDRSKNLERFSVLSVSKETDGDDDTICKASFEILSKGGLSIHTIDKLQSKKYSSFEAESEIYTSKLLVFLIYHFLSDTVDTKIQEWLDFLIQRFEVSKKIFELYQSEKFRTGKGDYNIVRLYWLFSVLLTIAYSQTKNLKYLSTLLKTNDLICSLSNSDVISIPCKGLDLILSNEVIFIKNLFRKVGENKFDFE